MEGVVTGAPWAVARPVGIAWKPATFTIRGAPHRVVQRRPHWEIPVPVTHAPMASAVGSRAIESYVFGSAMAGTRVEVWKSIPAIVHQVRARGQSVISCTVAWQTSLLARVDCGRALDIWSLRNIKLASRVRGSSAKS